MTTLRSGRAICEGYAELFLAMATKAGLNAVLITGGARFVASTDYSAGDPHAWNGVQLDDGSWGLLDATWDSGYDDVGPRLTRQYSTQWFLPDNSIFVSTHFPGRPENQFMQYSKIAPSSTPISDDVWEASAVVTPDGTTSPCAEK